MPVLTYNVLCPELARPSHYHKTDPKHLDADTRYAKVKARLDEAIAGGTIIALQEVDVCICVTETCRHVVFGCVSSIKMSLTKNTRERAKSDRPDV